MYSFHVEAEGEYWPLYSGHNTVGREDSGEELDIHIKDPTTSSRHAVLISDFPGRAIVQDEGSTNGTFVNDRHLGHRGSVEVRDGDRIRFGGYCATVCFVTR